jgi:AbrB family looped-hinge helix DNA binding protein
MTTAAVTSKGQVTIPKEVRQKLGIRQGSRIQFRVVGDHVELRVSGATAHAQVKATSGFGLLKSRRAAVPADFDPASLHER